MKIRKIFAAMTALSVAGLCGVMASATYVPTATVNADKTVTVEVKAQDVELPATQFAVTIPDGYKVTSYTAVSGGYFNQDSMKFAWAGTSAPANDTVMLTLTLTADETVGDVAAIEVGLTPDTGFEKEVSADKIVVDLTADATDEDTKDETSEPTTSDETSDVTSEETGDVTSEETEEGEVTEDTDETDETDEGGVTDTTEVDNTGDVVDENKPTDTNGDNPHTGVGLAVMPAMLAGAVAVATRKRK